MTETHHYAVIRAIKILLFAGFAANAVRILYRTWKYGGSKSVHTEQWGEMGDMDTTPGDSDDEV